MSLIEWRLDGNVQEATASRLSHTAQQTKNELVSNIIAWTQLRWQDFLRAAATGQNGGGSSTDHSVISSVVAEDWTKQVYQNLAYRPFCHI